VATGLGLEAPAREALAAWRARPAGAENARLRQAPPPDGLPLPPDRLVYLVAGTADLAWFLEGGARAAASIREALAEASVDLGRAAAVLDFGCGCGRVARHWSGLSASVHGCDVNPSLVRWCRRSLPFGAFTTTRLDPPLPYDSSAFDVVYALSVFTHLDDARQRRWMDELHRVTRPGGHLLISTHGQGHRADLDADERARFDRGELVMRRGDAPGSNACGAYHPERHVREALAPPFAVVGFGPEGARGNPRHDLWVLRRA
jgi:SAM-dependent methyltransferase